MINKYLANPKIPLTLHKVGLFLLLVFLVYGQLTNKNHLLYAQNSYQELRIDNKNHILTLSTKDADLKNILYKLSDLTDIDVEFPRSLEKKITIELDSVTLKEALCRILKGLNHVIIYSGRNKNKAEISKVFVFKNTPKSRATITSNRRIDDRISNYERRIESIKKNMSNPNLSNIQRQNYLRQIRRLENNIDNLRRQFQ